MIELNYTIVFQMLIFLLVFFVLRKTLYEPLFEIFDKRKELIDNRISEAKRLIEESEQLLKDYESRLLKARQEVVKFINEAKIKAQEEQRLALIKLRSEVDMQLNALKLDLEKEKEEARKLLKDMVANMVPMILEKILGRRLEVTL